MRSLAKHLWSEEGGAAAPIFALALPGLVMAGAIAFDYARLASLDTELQNAADQAALAAASQLDGGTTAITRATAAAQTMVVNSTRFANDGNASGTTVTVPTLVFYKSYDAATDTPGAVTTDGTEAKFVQITVGNRYTKYVLTPIMGLLNSGNINASAVAGLGSGVCKVPPLMICGPSASFPTSSDIGKGVRLQPGAGADLGAWVPGDYGYLDFGNGASGVKSNLGENQSADACFDNSNGIKTEPGNKASVTSALNSRFDIYGPGTTACDSTDGDYCPAENTRKDYVRKEVVDVLDVAYPEPLPLPPPAAANPGCGAAGATVSDFEQLSTVKGLTRDICHIDGTCTTNFGNGTWDVGAYFAANHPAATVPTGVDATRYSVYKWELADKNARLISQLVSSTAAEPKVKGNNKKRTVDYSFTNYCAYPTPKNGTGIPVSSTQKDRRLLTVASVDCTGLNGKDTVRVLQWVDVFLIEPSGARSAPYATGKDQIYGEIVGIAPKPDGSTAFQYYSRNRPYLIK